MVMPRGFQWTPRRERFCREFLVDCCGKDAAIRAGYSKKTAVAAASALMAMPQIQERIQQYMDERSARVEVKADDVLREVARVAFSNIKDIFDADGRLLPVDQMPRDVAAAISSIKVKTVAPPGDGATEVESVTEIKLWDKGKHLEMAGKHLKLWTERMEHSADDELRELLSLIKPTTGLPSERRRD